MSDQEIKQRIAYLVEHGGIYDDPLADIRRNIRVLYALVGVMIVLELVEVLRAVV
jgi:hypothetical protein